MWGKKKYLWRFSESFLFFVEFEKFFSVQENIFVYMSEAKWPEYDVRRIKNKFSTAGWGVKNICVHVSNQPSCLEPLHVLLVVAEVTGDPRTSLLLFRMKTSLGSKSPVCHSEHRCDSKLISAFCLEKQHFKDSGDVKPTWWESSFNQRHPRDRLMSCFSGRLEVFEQNRLFLFCLCRQNSRSTIS